MKNVNASSSIGTIVSEAPDSILILQGFGIDSGRVDQSLELACKHAGVPVSDVLHALEQRAKEEITEPANASLTGLMAYIVVKHHTYCREELARLDQLLSSVARKHGDRHPELRRVQSLFAKMGNDLKLHLLKEEQTLFPMITRLEEARSRQAAPPKFPFGTIGNPIRMMILEHDTGTSELTEIRKLSSDYTVPADGDEEYSALVRALNCFEQDMKQHVYLENERLFPRAIALEQGGSAGAASGS